MTSKKMATNASAQQDTLHPQPTQRQTSLLNVQTLMNAPVKTAVMLMPHAAIMQAVKIALVTLATINLDLDTPENVITSTSAPFHHMTVTKTPPVVIPSVAMNANVTLVTMAMVLQALALTSMNAPTDHIPVMKTPLVPIMMVVSHALVTLAGTLVETVKPVLATMSMNVQKLSNHTHVVKTQNVSTTQVHMTVNACHHSIWLKVHVLTMMNAQITATTVTKVDQSAQMKPRPTLWNGLVVLPNTQ